MSRTTTLATAAAATALCAGALVAAAAPASAATVSSAASAAPSAAAAACDKAPWEAVVQGRPAAYKSGAPVGDYLWHDTSGFHLRITHGNSERRLFTGEIKSSSPMRVDPVKLEKGDVATLSADHKSLVFVFANYGAVDGIDFHTDCATSLAVSHLNVGNSALWAKDVYLGATDYHPSHVPFYVHRVAKA